MMTSEVVSEPLTHNDYSVGWVCALPKEQTAATAMLDEMHASLPKPPSDHNTYTLGSIGKHNVVIACLPKGKAGNTSAATITTNMISTFPAIRFSLMVGIGGGIPPKVRLGDVVVSTPVGQFPGVVQWDCNVKQAGKFERTGSLNNPPNALLAALTKVETNHELTGSRIPEYLEKMKDQWPRLVPKYLRSDSLEDILFKAGSVHVTKSTTDCNMISDDEKGEGEEDEEDNCRFCDKALMVMRKPREMRVHYGLIASGNTLVKDASFRDKVNQNLGGQVLCVETTAAGLAHAFPCIIIRGICDYADSHKNEAWQEHAAAVAAALAKELLHYIQPSDVKGERMAKDILKEIQNTVSRTEADIREVKSKFNRKEDMDILKWLTPINYGPQQSDYLSQRQEGTGQWLLRSKVFQEWVETDNQTLFCPGVPGAGKTILTSIVIDNLTTRFGNAKDIGIAYIYGNFRRQDEHKARNLLENLLKQLAQGQSTLPACVKSLHDEHKHKGTRPSLDKISATLQSATRLYSQVFIIVDALDEFQVSSGCRTRFLEEIFKLQTGCRANLFATSRFIPEITETFKDRATFEIRAHDEDVLQYLDSRISQSGQRLLQTNREEIKKEITKAVGGMFLLAQLHFDSVCTKKTPKNIKDVLNTLSTGPKAYDLAYEKVMERITSQDPDSAELAKQVLSWVVCARRLLTTLELQHALAVEVGEPELDEKNLPQIEDMVSVCAGLVTVDEESDIFRLVHYTTQDYFDRTQELWFPDSQSDITITCVTYLAFSAFESGICASEEEGENRLLAHPFYDYAARNWGHHALMASMDGNPLILSFLECEANLLASFQATMALKRGHYAWYPYTDREEPMEVGVHAAAYFGLSNTVLALLMSGHNADSKDNFGCTPLSYAAQQGFERIVELLVARNEVDLHSYDFVYGMRPLSWAAKGGHEAAVRMLLGKEGIIPDLNCREGSPLLLAAKNGHDNVVKLLLSRDDVDLNSIDYGRMTPLSWAARNGHEAVLRLLLNKRGVVPESKDIHKRTPLSWAAENGHSAVAKMLLDIDGIDPDSKDSAKQTPLSLAAGNGHSAVVKMLLDIDGIGPDSKDSLGRTPLSLATRRGHEGIVKLLLEKKGVDPDSKDYKKRTPLLWAAAQGYAAMVKMLLAIDAVDPNYEDVLHKTPLLRAVENGHEAAVRLLLVRKVEKYGGKLLGAAADRGYRAILKLLATSSTISDSRDEVQTPTVQAAGDEAEDIPPILVGSGSQEETTLHWAAENGRLAVVRTLLEAGASVDEWRVTTNEWSYGKATYSSNNERTALHLAADHGHMAIVSLLLDHGANVNSISTTTTMLIQSMNTRTVRIGEKWLEPRSKHKAPKRLRAAVDLAASKGYKAIVNLLLERGAEVHVW